MKSILTLYLLRQMALAFALATGGVTFVVLFTQSFRLLSLVIENSSTAGTFFQLLGLSSLSFLPLIMPLGLGAAVVFVYNKLASDSELVVMRAAGMSPWRILCPALLLALVVTILSSLLTLWVTPAANRHLVSMQYKTRNSYAVFLSHPGTFNDLTRGLTFYANKRGKEGALQGILIQDVRDPDKTVTTMAAAGKLVDADGHPRMLVFDGRRQEVDRATGKLSELVFDQYVLDLEALRKTAGKRFPDQRELTLATLMDPPDELVRARGPLSRFQAELHTRFATPLLAFSYALVAGASILVGAFNRRGMAGRIVLGVLAMVVIQAAFMTLASVVARNIQIVAVLYVIPLLPIPLALAFLFSDAAPEGGGGFRRLRRARP